VPKPKKIAVRFKRRSQEVVIKGLSEDEDVPEELNEVLARYGYKEDSSELYVDFLEPMGDDAVEELGMLALYVPVAFEVERTSYDVEDERYDDEEVAYTVTVGDYDMPDTVSVTADTFYDALSGAFIEWNKAGRRINGLSFEEAVKPVLEDANAERLAEYVG
jgi:hypothetical protein